MLNLKISMSRLKTCFEGRPVPNLEFAMPTLKNVYYISKTNYPLYSEYMMYFKKIIHYIPIT